MIGEQYFPLRQDLAKLTAEALVLSKAAGCEAIVAEPLNQLREEEQEALLLLVLGDNPQGNVEFISTLIGLTEMLPSEQQDISRLRHYVHGKSLRLSEKEPEVEGLEINALFLNDFEILDTPGAAFHTVSLRSMILRCVPAADFILMVISAADPWNGSTWALLMEIPAAHLPRVIILLQKEGLPASTTLAQLERDILDNCQLKLSFQPPLFAIPYEQPEQQTWGTVREESVQPLLEHIYFFSNPDKHRKGLFRARIEKLEEVADSIWKHLQLVRADPSASAVNPAIVPGAADKELLALCDRMIAEVKQTIGEGEITGLQELKAECGPVKSLSYELDKGFQMWSVFTEKVMATVTSSARELTLQLESEMGRRKNGVAPQIIDYEELLKDLIQSPRRYLNSMTWQNRFYFALSFRRQKLRWLSMLTGAGLILALAGAIGGWAWAWWGGLAMTFSCSALFWMEGFSMDRLYQFWQTSVARASAGVQDSLNVVMHHEVAREVKQSGEADKDHKMAPPKHQPLQVQAENLQNRIGKLRERLDESME